MIKIVSVVGARPQFVKMAAICKDIESHNRRVDADPIEHVVIHTGQHYDIQMSDVFFDELGIPEPEHNLEVGSGTHAAQTGSMLQRTERVLMEERPDIALVYGDTNSTLAGALAAAKLHIPVAHVEAGLRSYRKHMPEEVNRVATDHLSTVLFCPSERAIENLQHEGFVKAFGNGRRVTTEDIRGLSPVEYSVDRPLTVNVGDVMFDSVLHLLSVAEGRSDVIDRLSLKKGRYYLTTVHRAENTDRPENLRGIIRALNCLADRRTDVLFPIHPRTKKALSALEAEKIHSNVEVIDPVSYLDMLVLEQNASMILTDSGGVQKEAFFLQVPCVTLREETEWMETVDAGWNILAGADPERILKAIDELAGIELERQLPRIYGDGKAADYITQILARWASSHD